MLRPSFYRDQKQIALLTHEGKVPQSIVKDLADARRLKTLKANIAASAEQVRELLGHFYQGYETDFQRAEKAIEITSEIFKLSVATPIPQNLANIISYGSDPPPIIKQVGNELQESLDEWGQLAKELNSLLPARLFAQLKFTDLRDASRNAPRMG